MAPKKVLVALSGGVDSSVAAALLVDQGRQVTAVTLKLWGGETDSGCCSVSDVDDARRVAQQLGIDHHVFNFGEDFNAKVVDPYVEAYAKGRVPNPCIECNRHIKFDKLLRRADALGFDQVATGHHAQIVELGDGTRRVARGADQAKDQSYVLHMLKQADLARLEFPVGSMSKDVVRQTALDLGLRTADKPDSQDVCFIEQSSGRGDRARRAFLGDRIELKPARIVDHSGAQVGEAPAIELVAMGQRKGLGLGGAGERRYVVDIDTESATVTVGSFGDTLVSATAVPDLVWSGAELDGEFSIQCSAHGARRPATIEGTTVVWNEPQPKVSRGQSVVVYLDDQVVAGGIAD